jgi:hypothetical protein
VVESVVESRIGTEVRGIEPLTLPEGSRERFRGEGFLTVDALLTPAEVEQTKQLVLPLLRAEEPRADGMLYDYASPDGDPDDAAVLQLLLPFDYAPGLFDTAFFRKAAALAHALLGPQLRYRGSHYIAKPPRGDNPTPFHQDEAFWDPGEVHEAVAVWLPWSEVTAAHGCMRYVPRPIADETILAHRHIGGDPRVHGLELAVLAFGEETAIDCPLGLGGVTVHHCRSVHGTAANTAGTTREALIVNFAAESRALATPRDFPWQRASESAHHRERRRRGIDLP